MHTSLSRASLHWEQSNLTRHHCSPNISIRFFSRCNPIGFVCIYSRQSGVRDAGLHRKFGQGMKTCFPSTCFDLIKAHEYSARISIALAFWPPHRSGIMNLSSPSLPWANCTMECLYLPLITLKCNYSCKYLLFPRLASGAQGVCAARRRKCWHVFFIIRNNEGHLKSLSVFVCSHTMSLKCNWFSSN